MAVETDVVEPITAREWIRGFLFVLIPIAVIVLVIWALVALVEPCGCTRPA